ncbi:MAG: anaerobic glycerol-3-phosphate dehydrogenase subunit C [bacterium]
MEEIVQELRKRVQGEVRFDKYSRVLYSTDASIYQIEPKGVILPRTAEDAQAVVEIANKHDVAIVPRGGGTSLVGQSIGAGIIIDFSKYMNKILEVNREERWARIQPGVVLDQLNHHVGQYDLFFGPDVATSSRANLGGLIGNNSSGARSVVYGKTIDHILEMEVLLSDGSQATLTEMPAEGLRRASEASGRLNSICAAAQRIGRENKDEIDNRFPKILRRVGGYNLDAFTGEKPFNLSNLIVGSEGTLAVVTAVKVNLVPKPRRRVLGIIHFNDLFGALEAVSPILEFNPSAVELIDDIIINLTRATREYARRMTFVEGRPAALLLVEFQGDSRGELKERLANLVAYLAGNRIGYAHVQAVEAGEQADVWYVRKAGLGLLLGTRAARKPVGFVEDTAVAPDRLADYIRDFDQVIKHHRTEACYYAHASVGLLHIRPMLNLKSQEDIGAMRSIAEAVSDLVLKYGGAFSGEHGDGLARSCFNEKMFGPKLYQAFREIKRTFDPGNILNPGKIVDAQQLTENLRDTLHDKPAGISTFLNFAPEGGFATAIEMCNGNGVCRQRDTGTMCPSFMVTAEEEHSTRGRANALRAVLSGRLDYKEFTSERMHKVFDLCIGCKGCRGECPTNVDMAKVKAEFLYHYHRANGLSLRDRFFGHVETLNKIGCATSPVSNWLLKTLPMRWFMQQLLGISCHRSLPPFAGETFTRWCSAHQRSRRPLSNKKVALFHDTFMTYNYPQVGIAAVQLLEAAGYEVVLPDKKCCGRPFISKGMLGHARACAQQNLARLSGVVDQGIPIVGCEPSCVLTFREEYPDLVTDSRARALAENSFLLEEFLTREQESDHLTLPLSYAQDPFLLHGHCHAKALVGLKPTVAMLNMIPGAEVEVVDSGCCGMAGAFGFEKEHYQLSLAMGRRKLFEAVESNKAGWQIVAPGVSCRQQIEHGTGRIAKHPAEVLAAHLLAGAEAQILCPD